MENNGALPVGDHHDSFCLLFCSIILYIYVAVLFISISTIEWMNVPDSSILYSHNGGVENAPTNEKLTISDLIPVSNNP